jgi:predicted DNA-binding transcriptional regulator YafY
LARALVEGRTVTIRYSDGGLRVTERVIRPLEVRHNRLVAWCYLRNDQRTFILERIEAVWDGRE